MSRENAAIAAGFPPSIAFRRRTPALPVNLDDIFQQKGLTNHDKVAKILEGMSATKPLFVDGVRHDVPDWAARYKFTELALKTCGQLKTENTPANDPSAIKNLAQLLKAATERVAAGTSRIYVKHEPEVIDVCPSN